MVAVMKSLKTCPICFGKRIHKVRMAFSQVIAGRKVRIPNVECYECPDCGEHIYDPVAADRVLALPSHGAGKPREPLRFTRLRATLPGQFAYFSNPSFFAMKIARSLTRQL